MSEFERFYRASRALGIPADQAWRDAKALVEGLDYLVEQCGGRVHRTYARREQMERRSKTC